MVMKLLCGYDGEKSCPVCMHPNIIMLYNICIYCHLLKSSKKQTIFTFMFHQITSNKLLGPLNNKVFFKKAKQHVMLFLYSLPPGKIKFYNMVMTKFN